MLWSVRQAWGTSGLPGPPRRRRDSVRHLGGPGPGGNPHDEVPAIFDRTLLGTSLLAIVPAPASAGEPPVPVLTIEGNNGRAPPPAVGWLVSESAVVAAEWLLLHPDEMSEATLVLEVDRLITVTGAVNSVTAEMRNIVERHAA